MAEDAGHLITKWKSSSDQSLLKHKVYTVYSISSISTGDTF